MSFVLGPTALSQNGYIGLWQVECPAIGHKEQRRNCISYVGGSVREEEGEGY